MVLMGRMFSYRQRIPKTSPDAEGIIAGPGVGLVPALSMVTLAVVLAPGWVAWKQPAASNGVEISADTSQLELTRVPHPMWMPGYSGYDGKAHWRGKIHNSLVVELTVLSYREQYQGKELIYFDNVLAPEATVKNMGSMALGNEFSMSYSLVAGKGRKALVLWAYKVGSSVTQSELEAKLLQLPVVFSGKGASSLVTFYFPCQTYDCNKVISAIDQKSIGPQLAQVVESITVSDR